MPEGRVPVGAVEHVCQDRRKSGENRLVSARHHLPGREIPFVDGESLSAR